MQSLEILPVGLSQSQILLLQPDHAESFILGWPAGARPEEVATRALAGIGIEPKVLHSTSWRHSGEEVVLTYLAVLEATVSVESWSTIPVVRADLARGDKTAPPPIIGIAQVLEHALRHLAWLVKDDPEIREALPDWPAVLADYKPEPFRALGAIG